jgi:hypothetical protein
MATLRSRQQAAVGSAPWIEEEKDQIRRFIHQEAEDFAFSARNEVDWLNEHMTEIFTSNQFLRRLANYEERLLGQLGKRMR